MIVERILPIEVLSIELIGAMWKEMCPLGILVG